VKLSKVASSLLLAILISPLFQPKARAGTQESGVRLAAESAQRATAVSGNRAPSLSAPKTTTISEGVLTSIEATGMDTDPEDSLTFSVTGLPQGMKAIIGVGADGKKVASAFGIVESAGQPFTVTWSVTDGVHDPVTGQTRVSVSRLDTSRMEERVGSLIHGNTRHGLDRSQARELGVAALPVLARMLRDENEKSRWPEVIVAMGAIGDTAYFDTLYSFVWQRFSGEVDDDTFYACEIVQANLGFMANLSPRVVTYLQRCVNPATWASLPWHSHNYQGDRLEVQMSEYSITSFSHLNDALATKTLMQLDADPYSPKQRHAINSALKTNTVVRRLGILEYQKQIEGGGQ
jgi:hypothetical protein